MNTPLSQLQSLDRYTLLRELGRGGMSVVYLAKDSELGREVAIKCVDTSDPSAAKLAERLRSEAKLLAQLNHPNIVQLYDVVEQENILGLVIEFIGGDTLTQRLKQAPSKEVKLKWLAEVADGLASAHQKGIAHCDLKADNVLITHDNIAKVADFGIAKVKLDDYLEDDGLTRVDNVSGSYFSLSPEQATGQAVDTRTDLFSFATLVHQTLTGEHPFGDTSNKVALLQRVINDEPTISTSAKSILGARLSELIKTQLSKSPGDRLYTASEVGDLLKGAQTESSAQFSDDQTIEIPVRKAPENKSKERSNSKPWLARLSLLATGFLVGLGIIKISQQWAETPAEVQYVALDTIEIETSDDFNQQLLPLIKSALQESAEQALLSLENTSLISNREFQSIEGSYKVKAKATGVKSIIRLSADCGKDKCDLKLRKLEGEHMAVSEQKAWPVAVQSLTDIRDNTISEIALVYPSSTATSPSSSIPEEDYRAFLKIVLDSQNGTNSSIELLKDLESFIERQPFFLPSYDLTRKIAEQLYSRTKDTEVLTRFEGLLSGVPSSLKNNTQILGAKMSLYLLKGENDKAEEIFALVSQTTKDKVTRLELETDIAYYNNESQRLLHLDRQSAILRPSSRTLYNLATSEYSFGNYEASLAATESALELQPNHPLALSLKATISMITGNIAIAISSYEDAIDVNPSSSNFSNLGLSFMLKGDYEKAIKRFLLAIEKSPSKAKYKLNVADAYMLSDQRDLSLKYYKEVLDSIDTPVSAEDFWVKAQAQAQIGSFIKAVRTLNNAVKEYPNNADLKYSSALVFVLSDDITASLVAVEDAVDLGIGAVWFNLPWFKPLCSNKEFTALIQESTKQPLCDA